MHVSVDETIQGVRRGSWRADEAERLWRAIQPADCRVPLELPDARELVAAHETPLVLDHLLERAGRTKCEPQALEQERHDHRLGEKVGGARLERRLDGGGVLLSCEHQDR